MEVFMEDNLKLENATKIIDNYYLMADDKQYILACIKKSVKKDTGEEYKRVDTLGYYNTIPGALKACMAHMNRQKIQAGDFSTIKDCINQYVEAYNKFCDMFECLN